jgi:uncharacterized membrane protein YkoI
MPSRFAHSVFVALMLVCASAWSDVGRDEAAAAARQAAGGRVLSVDKAQVGNRSAWRVKLVTAGGDVQVVMIDAATGKPL